MVGEMAVPAMMLGRVLPVEPRLPYHPRESQQSCDRGSERGVDRPLTPGRRTGRPPLHRLEKKKPHSTVGEI